MSITFSTKATNFQRGFANARAIRGGASYEFCQVFSSLTFPNHALIMDLKSLSEIFTHWLGPSPAVVIITFLIALASPLLLHTYLYRSKARTHLPALLLAGPSGAGKTSLMTLVRYRSLHNPRKILSSNSLTRLHNSSSGAHRLQPTPLKPA